MEQFQLLAGEHNVMTLIDGTLILTNFRVTHETANREGSAYKSIPIKKISACALTTKKHPFLLLLAGLLGLAGLAVLGGTTVSNGMSIAPFALAGIFILVYFLTQNGQFEVYSDSGARITLPTDGLTPAQLRIFAEAVAQEICKA